MAVIVVKPTQAQIDDFKNGPTWEVSPTVLHSQYRGDEYFLALRGSVDLDVEGQGLVHIQEGDLVLIQQGTKLDWLVHERFRKAYKYVAVI